VRGRPYVEAVRLAGASRLRLLWRHILPNSLAPVIVMATILVGSALIIEAALSFLGLGLVPPEPSWGGMVDAGRAFMSVAPWVVLLPVAVLAVAVIAINLLGDGLREALDPTLF
jgi:peptide/nickel transport system permease protein